MNVPREKCTMYVVLAISVTKSKGPKTNAVRRVQFLLLTRLIPEAQYSWVYVCVNDQIYDVLGEKKDFTIMRFDRLLEIGPCNSSHPAKGNLGSQRRKSVTSNSFPDSSDRCHFWRGHISRAKANRPRDREERTRPAFIKTGTTMVYFLS